MTPAASASARTSSRVSPAGSGVNALKSGSSTTGASVERTRPEEYASRPLRAATRRAASAARAPSIAGATGRRRRASRSSVALTRSSAQPRQDWVARARPRSPARAPRRPAAGREARARRDMPAAVAAAAGSGAAGAAGARRASSAGAPAQLRTIAISAAASSAARASPSASCPRANRRPRAISCALKCSRDIDWIAARKAVRAGRAERPASVGGRERQQATVRRLTAT